MIGWDKHHCFERGYYTFDTRAYDIHNTLHCSSSPYVELYTVAPEYCFVLCILYVYVYEYMWSSWSLFGRMSIVTGGTWL